MSKLNKNLGSILSNPTSSEINQTFLRVLEKITNDFICIMANYNHDVWKKFELQTDQQEKITKTLSKILNRFEKYSNEEIQMKSRKKLELI